MHRFQDIRFTGVFQLLRQTTELISLGLAIFFTNSALIPLFFNLATNLFWALFVAVHQPCRNVRGVNIFQCFSYSAIAWSAVCAIISYFLNDRSSLIPSIVMVWGWFLLIGFFVYVYRGKSRFALALFTIGNPRVLDILDSHATYYDGVGKFLTKGTRTKLHFSATSSKK